MNEISGPAANLPEPWNEQARVESAIRPRIALTPSPTSANSIDAMGLLTAFRRRWRLALGLAFLGMCLIGAGVWFFAPPPKFIAEALLLVEAEQPRIIASTKEYQVDPITDRATQVALIKSLVVSKVLTKPEIAKLELFKSRVDPAAWLVSELKAEFSGKMLRLALSSDDPAAAATVIKAITQVYLTEVANKEKTQRIERNVTLEKHYDDLQKRLEKKRALLKGLATDLGAKDKQALSLQQRLAISRQSMAEEELLQTQADLKHAMAELKILQKKEERSAEAVEPSSNVRTKARSAQLELEKAMKQDESLQKYLQQEANLTATYEHFRRIARSAADPAVQRAKQELLSARQRRKKYEDSLRASLRTEQEAEPTDAQQAESSLATLKDQVEVLSELERDLTTEVTKYVADTRKLGSQAVEMESIQEEIHSADEMVKLIGGELEALKIELNAPDRVRLIKEAKAPVGVDKSRQIKMTGMSAGGAFAAIIMLISFWEFRAQRINSHKEVAQGLGIRVVGTLPPSPPTISDSLSKRTGQRQALWQHQLIESVDAIRIMLGHTVCDGSLRTLLVTSAVGGEGKTSLSNHLATSLARSGQKTLLIDGDFRRPMVHSLYDQDRAPGFCELLRGESASDDVVRPTPIGNLWIIPAGNFDSLAMAALSQPSARSVFSQLRKSSTSSSSIQRPCFPWLTRCYLAGSSTVPCSRFFATSVKFPRSRRPASELPRSACQSWVQSYPECNSRVVTTTDIELHAGEFVGARPTACELKRPGIFANRLQE